MRKELLDPKLKAMYDLAQELKYAPYDVSIVKRVLTAMEHRGIVYLLDELPEGQSYDFYCKKLDDFLINVIKGAKK
jgi:hypothetical protein